MPATSGTNMYKQPRATAVGSAPLQYFIDNSEHGYDRDDEQIVLKDTTSFDKVCEHFCETLS